MFAKARRLDPDKLRKAEAEFRELEAAGIRFRFTIVLLTSALLNLPKGKSLGHSKPATNS